MITNKNHTTLYTGVTSNLAKRMVDHKNDVIHGFASKYKLQSLVYVEEADSLEAALFRENQIKAGSREKKINLINKMNPSWDDLTDQYCSLG
jgi:putative endonuclease